MPSVTGTSSAAHTTNAAQTLTFSHTTNSDALYVSIAIPTTSTSVIAVTFGGVDLTFLSRLVTGTYEIEWWWLQSPGTSTANIFIDLFATNSQRIAAVARNVLVSDLASIQHDFTITTGSSTTPSKTVTPLTTGGLVLDMVTSDNNLQTFTQGGGQTLNIAQDSEANTQLKVAGSSEAGGASVTMSWTLASTEVWYLGTISITTITVSSTRVSQVATEILTSTTIIIPPSVSESTQFLIVIM